MKVTEFYFERESFYREKYGEKTILLMQVGSFFEVYGKKNQDTGVIHSSKINEFSNICDLNIGECSKQYLDNCIVVKGGFRDYSIDKYVDKIVDSGYNCIIYDQDSELTRKCSQIITAGTHFTCSNEKTSNSIMVISLYHKKPSKYSSTNEIIYGVANIDVLSGDTNVFETEETYCNNLTSFDELEKNYSIYTPNEIIFIYDEDNMNTKLINDVVQYISCNSKTIRLINLSNVENNLSRDASLFKKDKYKTETIKKYYPLIFENVIQSIHHTQFAYESLCFLLDYIHKHNENMSNSLTEPTYITSSEKLLLANHSLKQLNIINTSSEHTDNNSSLLKFLNKCITPMGKRKFKHDLVNPIIKSDKLEREYNIIESMINEISLWNDITKDFNQLKDMDKQFRKITLMRSIPSDICNIYQSIQYISKTYERICENDNFISLSPFEQEHYIIKDVIKKMESKLRSIFDIEKLSSEYANDYLVNFFNRGYDVNMDDIEMEYMESNDKLSVVMKYYSDLIKSTENKPKQDCYLKIKETSKSGISLKLSDTRGKKLISKIKKERFDLINLSYISSYDNVNKSFSIINKGLTMEKCGADSILNSPYISQSCEIISRFKSELYSHVTSNFKSILRDISNYNEEFTILSKFIVSIDVRHNKAKIAIKYNYCKPQIANDYDDESYIESTKMRHPLIENIITDEIYVPNDIVLTPDEKGILLFGTNAVGKSSLIKSIGMSIIMAQSGMYVPCSEFKYRPFDSLFTRILGNDNIFKGLSTFAVEMSELRTILKYSTSNSLVLGDELCSGTELGSAISIFVAGLIQLYKKNSKYIFATHFHEITDMTEVTDLTNMKLKHMTVLYNAEIDALVYDRVLRDGPGNNMYGLEVCKSLNLPQDFLDLANTIREKKFSNITSISSTTGSAYNSKKLKTDCEMCGKKSCDVHHLQHQKYADENQYIGHFNKNHVANLMNLCQECHTSFHKDDTQYKRVKTTIGYKVVPIVNLERNI